MLRDSHDGKTAAGSEERKQHTRLSRVFSLSNIYFVYLHTVQESDSTVREVNKQHGRPAFQQRLQQPAFPQSRLDRYKYLNRLTAKE